MDWNDFYKSLKAGQYENIYLFTGPEEYTKREALAALRNALLPPGLEALNEAVLEDCAAQEIIASAETLPVMCDRRIVVVRDWFPLKPGKGKNEETDVECISDWLQNPPETCILIFYMSVEMDGRKKLSTMLKKMKGYVEFGRLSGAVLMKWCNQHLRKTGQKLRPDAFDELTLIAGHDLVRLSGELEKLSAYVGSVTEITIEDVRAVVAPAAEYSVFVILDHLLSGRLTEATETVNRVLQTEPSVIRLISMFANQLRIDAHMKYALEGNRNMAQVTKALNVSEYRARHILRQIRPMSAKTLEEGYLRCVKADFEIKSGRIRDRAALDKLMLEIAIANKATKMGVASSNG